jgi:hypothetical protein
VAGQQLTTPDHANRVIRRTFEFIRRFRCGSCYTLSTKNTLFGDS